MHDIATDRSICVDYPSVFGSRRTYGSTVMGARPYRGPHGYV